MRMDEIELTRLMKELMRFLQHMPSSEVDEGRIDDRVEAIKRELGAWFIEGYTLYQAS
jgi:hypothetical protein